VSNDAITAIRQRSERKYAGCTVADAIHDVGTLLALLGTSNDALSMRQQRDQWMQMYDCLVADTNMVIDGLRDQAANKDETLGAYTKREQDTVLQLAAVTAERDESVARLQAANDILDGTLALQDIEIKGLRSRLAALAAEPDSLAERLERRESAFTECERQLSILDAGAEVTVLSEIRRMQSALATYDAALAEVRGESKEVEHIRSCIPGLRAAGCYDRRLGTLLAAIDALQLQEAANRNGFAQAKAREQGLRERVDAADRCAAKLRENIGELIGEREDLIESRDAAESRVRELSRLLSEVVADYQSYKPGTEPPPGIDCIHRIEIALSPPQPAIVAGEQPEHCTLIPGEQVKLCTDYPACACGGQP
jgi:chromosome segregation ATPase